jgi:hypothetical protein
MQVFSFPGALSYVELKLLEALSKRLYFSPLAPGFRVLGGQILQVGAHQSSQRSIALNRNLSDFLDEIVIERKSDVHGPIIRETLNMGNMILASEPTSDFGWRSGSPLRSRR